MPRGPKPKNETLRIVSGANKRDQGALDVAATSLPCPAHLTGLAGETWREVVETLGSRGTLAGIDRAALEVYCQAVQTHREVSVVIAREGYTVEGKQGTTRHPLLGAQKDAALLIRQYAALFGLSPADRGRVKVPLTRRDNLDEMFGRRAKARFFKAEGA